MNSLNKHTNYNPNIVTVIVAIAILTFMGILSETGLNISYAILMKQFGVSAAVVQWLTTGYLLTLAILIPISPFWVKNFKTKKLFQAAAIVFGIGSLLCAVSWNFYIILFGRIIQAIGTSIALPLMTNIVLEQAPVEKRGYLMGIVGLVISFAPAMGPVLAGVINQFMNWHWLFAFMLPFLIVSFILGTKYITNITSKEKMTIDFPSAILSGIGFAGIVYGLSISGDSGLTSPMVLCSIIIGILSLVVFSYRQLHLKKPLIHINIFKYPMFSVGVLILMISMMTVLSAGFVLPLLLQKALGYSSMIAALAMLPGAIINGVMSPLTGKILDKRGPKILLSAGCFLMTAMLVIFSFDKPTLLTIVIVYAIFMFGASMLATPAQTNGLNQLPQEFNADGSAIMNTLQQVSGAIGTALASSILANKSASYLHQLTGGVKDGAAQAIIFGSHKAFMVFLVLCFIGFVMALFTRK